MPLSALLTRPVATLSAGETCAEAARRMRRQNAGSLVVERDGAAIGIVTDRDLALRVVAQELDPGRVPVEDVMSVFPASLTARRGVEEAIDVMLELGVRRLPAVDARGRFIGIVSLDDIVIELSGELGTVRSLLELERSTADLDSPAAE